MGSNEHLALQLLFTCHEKERDLHVGQERKSGRAQCGTVWQLKDH
jgi:hypothetical protein